MQAVGKSPLRILHERRMIECKRELTYSSQPIGQLAYELGFTDEAVILDRGSIVHRAASSALRDDPAALEAHLGVVGRARPAPHQETAR
jgi:AraC-like DNA-binding protein